MMVFKLCGGTGFIEEIEEDCANINSETELMRAAQRDDSETIAVLLKDGADIEARDKYGKTALMHAVSALTDKHKAIAALLKSGADIDVQDNAEANPYLRDLLDSDDLQRLRNA